MTDPIGPQLGWKTWRKAERERLIAERLQLSADERSELGGRAIERLDAAISPAAGSVVSFYWPFRGEIDLRPWITGLLGRGMRAALPVVTVKQAPMSFRLWSPGVKMERGIWNIPVPADSADVTPDVVLAPLVGFDSACFRLGYGGGYFDRTLAGLAVRPMVVGIGYGYSQLATIHPQPHDIRMDLIVTETEMIA